MSTLKRILSFIAGIIIFINFWGFGSAVLWWSPGDSFKDGYMSGLSLGLWLAATILALLISGVIVYALFSFTFDSDDK